VAAREYGSASSYLTIMRTTSSRGELANLTPPVTPKDPLFEPKLREAEPAPPGRASHTRTPSVRRSWRRQLDLKRAIAVSLAGNEICFPL
jgi:hypothetical protein